MDDDDKIRRNLMVVSAIIIGVAWFDVSLPDILERLFSIKSTTTTTVTATASATVTATSTAQAQTVQVAAWKVWIAALAVLSYLAWRYRWSEEVEKAWTLYGESVAARYAAIFQTSYLRKVEEWFRVGQLPKDAHPQLHPLLNQAVPQAFVKQLGRRPDVVTLRAAGEPDPTNGNEAVKVTVRWLEGSETAHERSTPALAYVDTRRQLALIWWARAFAAVNSKASMSLFWPVLLASAAFVIASWKLAHTLVR